MSDVHALKVGTDTVCGSAGILVSVSPKLDGVTCADCLQIRSLPVEKVTVQLFKRNGKWYCEDQWRIPTEIKDHSPWRGDYVREAIGPYDMRQSSDFRRIDGGPVLIEAQEPWGYPFMFPAESEDPTRDEKAEPARTEWTGQLIGGPDAGNFVTAKRERFEVRVRTEMWIDGPRGGAPADELMTQGWYVWNEATGTFRWEPDR